MNKRLKEQANKSITQDESKIRERAEANKLW
jgi:hypothetical protein